MSAGRVNISGLPGIASNITYLDQCNPYLCSLDYAVVRYVPNGVANLIIAIIFAIFLLIQLVSWFFYRTHSYTAAMFFGLALEILGYIGRIAMRNQLFVEGPFLVQIICLTIAPVFFTAALYLTLGRVIVHYGTHNSRLSPKAYTLVFISFDIIALVLQSVGGALADTAASLASAKTGTNVMVAGLSFQVISLTVFIALCAEFFWKVRTDQNRVKALNWARGDTTRPTAEVKGFKVFLGAFALATILIVVRSSFRVAELAHGFQSKLANDEVPFVILESGVMVVATFLLTFFHPGRFIGREQWKQSGWGAKKSSNITVKMVDEQESVYNRPWPMQN